MQLLNLSKMPLTKLRKMPPHGVYACAGGRTTYSSEWQYRKRHRDTKNEKRKEEKKDEKEEKEE